MARNVETPLFKMWRAPNAPEYRQARCGGEHPYGSAFSGVGALAATVSVAPIVFGVLVPFPPIFAGPVAMIWRQRRWRRSTGVSDATQTLDGHE